MLKIPFKTTAIALIASGLIVATPAAAAAPSSTVSLMQPASFAPAHADVSIEHHRGHDKRWKRGRGHRNEYRGQRSRDYRDSNYGDPIRRDTRVWRGRDGRYYCKKENGTTGLLIGAAVGGLIGNEVAGRGDRTLGAILGAAGGALLGREIDRSNSRCR